MAKNLKPYELVAVSPSRAIPYLKSQVDQRKTQLDNAKQQTQLFSNAQGSVKYAPPEQHTYQVASSRDEVRSIVL